MNKITYGSSIISKLKNLLDILPCEEDRNIIAQIIEKRLPKESAYNFSIEELASVTHIDASHHTVGVRNAEHFAMDYMEQVHGINLDIPCLSTDEEQNDKLDDFIMYNWRDKWKSMVKDFQITRFLVYRNTPLELRKDVAETFDLYMINEFIELFQQIKSEFESINSH